MADDPSKMTCPYICPTNEPEEKSDQVYLEAGMSRGPENPYAQPYVAGCIVKREPTVYPPGAPPVYLPQPTDSTSGDILGMTPIGPWASGHLDWTPQAGTTGVRPVVDKYSITRYSTGQWRKNNEQILAAAANNKAKILEDKSKKDIANLMHDMDNNLNESDKKLSKRVKDLSHWKKKVEEALSAITKEIELLDENRSKLKGASKILNMPEAISKECLELRTNRYEPDLVRDDTEQELVKEVAIVGEIRRAFNDTLNKVEKQMLMLKAAKSNIEADWGDKMTTLKLDKTNLHLGKDSNLILWHPGVVRWPENGTSLEYWEHYCKESIRNCDEVRKMSEDLRGDLMTIISKGSQDMKTQAERTNSALAETVAATEQMCAKLEETLKENLQMTANIENTIDHLKETARALDVRNKLVMTRLYTRNYERPSVENCRDEAQYSLMGEGKRIKEAAEELNEKLRDADNIRNELMKYRGELEKQIACKRKSLNIDGDRLARVRAHMPTPEEFAAA